MLEWHRHCISKIWIVEKILAENDELQSVTLNADKGGNAQGADLLFQDVLQLFSVFWVIQHPLKCLLVAHRFRQVLVEHLLHSRVSEELVQSLILCLLFRCTRPIYAPSSRLPSISNCLSCLILRERRSIDVTTVFMLAWCSLSTGQLNLTTLPLNPIYIYPGPRSFFFNTRLEKKFDILPIFLHNASMKIGQTPYLHRAR